MDNKNFNKIDKSQLTKIDFNNVSYKEPNGLDLSDVVNSTNIVAGGDTHPTHPCIGPARYNTIDLDKFEVSFDTPSFIDSRRVISISKPTYNIRKEKYISNKVMLAVTPYHAVHFFGKPSRYDNFFTDDEIVSLVKQFNEEKHKYMEVVELDSNGDSRIKTTYTAPRIYRIEFPSFDIAESGIPKYFIAEIHFNQVSHENLMPVEPEIIEEETEN